MDKIRIDGVSNNSLVPDRNKTSQANVISAETKVPESDIEDTNQAPNEYEVHSAINPLQNQPSFHIFRRAVLGTEHVTRFIDDHARKLENSSNKDSEDTLVAFLRDIPKIDKRFSREIQKELSHVGFDLVTELKGRIASSKSPLHSAVILKILFSLCETDEILSELVVPFTEERSNLADSFTVERNKKFYLQFLRSLEKADLTRILQTIKYHDVIRADNLAYALLEVAEPKFILDTLENHQVNLELSLEERLNAEQKIQMIELTILQNERARAKLEEIPDDYEYYCANLYLSSLTKRVSDDVAKLLSHHYRDFGKEIFLRQLTDSESISNPSDENRRRRYLGVNHLVDLINDDLEAASFLKGFILKEKDTFVLGNAVYLLANNLGQTGKAALTEVIVEQIRNEVTSLPFASLCLLYISKDKNVYLNLIKGVFSFDYENKEDKKPLRTAFKNLFEGYLCPDSKENGDFLFELVEEQNSSLLIDLINSIGIETFLQWASNIEDKALRTNTREVLDYASEAYPERIYNLLSWFLANDPTSSTAKLITELADMGQTGTYDETVTKINDYNLRN